jgi:hypothetical protein
MRIGATTPFAMTIIELTGTAMFSQDMMGGHQSLEAVIHLEMTKATQGLSGLLRWVAKQLNNRPRLGLGFKTPNDACY